MRVFWCLRLAFFREIKNLRGLQGAKKQDGQQTYVGLESELFSVKVGFYYGIDVSLSVNARPIMSISVRHQKEI
jgi:hypothetical protein